MARNILNEGCKTNVYLNRDPIQATLPVQAIQPTVNDPITISLKGLSGIGASNADKIIKVNSTGDSLIYADDEGSNWTLNSSNLYPLATSTNVLIGTTTNPNSHGMFLLDKELALKTSSGSFTYYGLKIIYDTYTVNNYVNNSGVMLWEGAQISYNFDKPLIINTQGGGQELSNGTQTYTLPTFSGGTLALTTQIPSNNNQLTNGAGFITASSTDTLTNKSISYSQITGTPTVITNNNQLVNGAGFITASSTNTLTNKSISYSQITGTPTVITNNNQLTNGAGFITASSTNTLTNKSISYSQITGTPTVITNNNQLVNGAGYITSSGWTFVSSTDTLHPLSSANTNVSLGTNSNPNTRRLLVSGIAEFDSTIQVGTTTSSNGLITLKKASGASATIELDTNSRLRIGNNGVGDVSIYTNGNNFQVSDSVSSNNNLVQIGSVIAEIKSSRTEVVELHTNKIQAKNNTSKTIVSSSTYGWEFSGTASRYKISFPGNYYYPFLGSDSSSPYLIHINNIGDAYHITGTNTSNLTHKFFGQTILENALSTETENSKAIIKINNAMRIDGYISTAGDNLVAPAYDGTVLATSTTQPFSNSHWQTIHGSATGSPYWTLDGSDYDPGNINTTGCSLVCNYALFLKGGSMFMACDRRIKHNIIEIDDNYALDILNKINMYKFKLNDWFENDYQWHYNVIAQEVLEHFPQAVSRHKDYLSNVMSSVNVNYTNCVDTNKYEMVVETKEEWGIKTGGMVKFYCAMNENGNSDILKLECIKNDNTFIIDKEYKYVLCYGIETDDMLTVDKQKIYSLSHSAIQQLHKNNIKQQEQINTQQEEINTLRTELDTYKSLMDKLINSKSFAEFKKNIA